ncbi:uncharacterized protein LOC124510081 isoform X2 [Lynx rufus]|uniref:uncharacterized protein LOC124510081 isoform X2 n=1 Tax=Lynx rufus TaxID=61384 RepID=UPI001F128923|nr:uncharacterized protein LOC124510081 isoform X2 [Lynx rufus]
MVEGLTGPISGTFGTAAPYGQDRDLGLRRRRWVVRRASGLDGVTPFFPHVPRQAVPRTFFHLLLSTTLRGESRDWCCRATDFLWFRDPDRVLTDVTGSGLVSESSPNCLLEPRCSKKMGFNPFPASQEPGNQHPG